MLMKESAVATLSPVLDSRNEFVQNTDAPPFVLLPYRFKLRKLLIQKYEFLTLETFSSLTFY